MSRHILGIRHHGPGSARAVRAFLEETKPDIVLVEGPPEGDALLEWAKSGLKPPVSLLVYQPDNPQRASFYPFAEFSPEWQAIQYALHNSIPVRFMDLPAAHSLALKEEVETEASSAEAAGEGGAALAQTEPEDEASGEVMPRRDPISYLAQAAGYEDGESWWEQTFEHRRDSAQIFDAVAEAMTALREALPEQEREDDAVREAYMRRVIREAEKDLFARVAIVCGAWHLPALAKAVKQKDDNELLKGLPKVKIAATWVPWTYGRLTYRSGYGAGIHSPGWYGHVWNHPDDDGTHWMSRVAQLFRSRGMDTSVAHVIEAVRLAESLAALRGRSRAGLEELNEATLSVLCNGEAILMNLIGEELIVSNTIGEVAEDVPRPPLQVDIEKQQKSLRLPAGADYKDYTLDLRKENDLERSIFLHRLLVLGIAWGTRQRAEGKGTFKEGWRLQWHPELSIDIIEKGAWGNTLEEAAGAFALSKAGGEASLADITGLLQEVIPAELPKAAAALSQTINNLAAASNDVAQLMKSIPPLARIVRYGNVRQTDADMVLQILASMVPRACIGLPPAATGIDADTAGALTDECSSMQHSMQLLQVAEFTAQWQQCLQQLANNQQAAPIIRGFATRQLMDYKLLMGEELYKNFHSSTSSGAAPAEAAAWLEGFLKGSGIVLLLDESLWQVVDDWVGTLEEEAFTQVLPLLRRTFATFTPTERRKMGEKARMGGRSGTALPVREEDFDHERAAGSLPVIWQLLGI